MTTPNSIVTPQTPKTWSAVATAAETAFHNPTNMVTLIDDATNTNGALVTKLYAIARAAIATACNCQLYKKVGSTYTLIDSALLAIHTPSASVANSKAPFDITVDDPLYVEASVGLAVAIGQGIANGVAFTARGGVY